ncbi:MAG: EscU/YscU/HrcU family type III secretion system export apparatus switch protein [Planctomycetes bacterium]|nr:EscU/YscU/HrcU family type III secretion system export apparatus switch protein [Planctomycetota bacterium]
MVKDGPLGERTEPGTAKRRGEARDSGHLPVSKDLEAAVMLVVGMTLLYVYGGALYEWAFTFTRDLFSRFFLLEMTPDAAIAYGVEFLKTTLLMMMPIFLAVTIAVVVTIWLEIGGFHWTWKPLTTFDLNRFNPISGIRRLMMSTRSLMKLVFSFMKMMAIFALSWYVLYDEAFRMVPTLAKPAELAGVAAIATYMWEVTFWLAMKISGLLLILAIFDWAYQRWQYEEDLKMSKKEIEEEMKMLEGDPKIRGRRREIQRKLAMQRMMKKVPKADVVITNPTELAVAVQYEPGAKAPKVVAKGAGALAQRIREIAAEHRIPIVEKKPLAQALYRFVEIDDYIPERFWQAVAEVLAYVYELDEKKKQAAMAG